MSDGESSREVDTSLNKRRRKNDEFAQAIARIAVAQVCESLGFHGFQQSALDTLSDTVCKYIREIGKTSSFYANLAGRTECNVFDVIQGLEDLSISQGFVGASDRDHCLLESGIVKEVSQYVSLSEEIGFAYSVPSFPVVKERESTSSFLQAGETPPTDDIPPWLPKFPDSNTYTSMSLAATEEAETRPDKVEQEQKVLEPPPWKLYQFWAHNESEFSVSVEHGENTERERPGNPFLAVPLQPGEKEVSMISLPAKLNEEDVLQNHSNHISELDTFVPVNQGVKRSGCETEEISANVVLNNRPTVQMKFSIAKKSLDIAVRHNDKGKEKVASWFRNDEAWDEKERRWDEKERRSEKLPREVMDVEEHTGNDSVVH